MNASPAWFITILIGGLVGLSLLVIFWRNIFAWLVNDLEPFFQKKYPSLAKYVKDAYTVLDNATVAAINIAHAAWQKTTDILALQTVKFSKKNGELVAELTTYTSQNPYVDNPQYERRVLKRPLEPEEVNKLPDDIKNDLHQGNEHTIDILDQRNQEFEKLGYTN
jgi:hypothetical protein